MVKLGDYNAEDHEPNEGFTPLPNGKYLAAITGSEMKQTSKGDDMLVLEFELLGDEASDKFKGRKLWTNLMQTCKASQTAVDIANGTLSAICRAVGVMKINDSQDLHNLPMFITVAVTKRADNGEPSNEIKKYESKAAAAGEPQQATEDDSAAWMKKSV